MNNETFLIEEYDLEQAKKACKGIKLENIRNRSVANFLAANLASKYFVDVDVDITSGIHNIQQVLERYDISDIYIKDCYIDVRLYFNENEILVPKFHFDTGILPVAYMFIKIGEDLSNAMVTGFIQPENVNTDEEFSGFYKVAEDDLVSYYEIEPLLIHEYADYPDDVELQIYNYLDKKHNDLNSFYKALIAHSDARKILQTSAKAQLIFNQVNTVSETHNTKKDEQNKEGSLGFYDDVINDLEDFNQETNFVLDGEDDDLLDVELSENDFSQSDELTEDVSISVDDLETLDGDIQELSLDEAQSGFEFSTSTTPSIDTIESTLSEHDNSDDVLLNEDTTLEDNLDMEISLGDESDLDEISLSEDTGLESEFDENTHSVEENSFDDLDSNDEQNENIVESEIIEDVNDTQVEEISIIDEDDESESVEVIDDEITIEASANAYENSANIDDEEQEYENVQEDNRYGQSEQVDEYSDGVSENSEIDYLFNSESNDEDDIADDDVNVVKKQKKMPPVLPLLSVLVVASAIGYFVYNKLPSNNIAVEKPINKLEVAQNIKTETEVTKPAVKAEPKVDEVKKVAMPNETVENVKQTKVSEEAVNDLLPNIQSVTTPVNISNMAISFEVPSAYLTYPTVKRYFAKIGKVLQLNIKNQLLLSNKAPLTNTVTIELNYNANKNRFCIAKFINAPGDADIQNTIKTEVERVLNYDYNINLNSLNDIKGNPILVIKF